MLRRWFIRVRWRMVRWLLYRHTLRATHRWYAVTWQADLDALADRIARYLYDPRRDRLYSNLLTLWLPVPVATWLAQHWPARWVG